MFIAEGTIQHWMRFNHEMGTYTRKADNSESKPPPTPPPPKLVFSQNKATQAEPWHTNEELVFILHSVNVFKFDVDLMCHLQMLSIRACPKFCHLVKG